MASIPSDENLPSVDHVLGAQPEPTAPAGADETVPALDAPFADQAGDDFDELRVNPGEQPAPAAEKRQRKPVQEYVPVLLRQNIYIGQADDLKPTDKERPVVIPLSATTAPDLQGKIASIDGDKLEVNRELLEWLFNLNDGTILLQDDDLHERALSREGSEWKQRLQGKNYFIGPAYRGTDPSKVASKMSGTDAVDLFIQGTGNGRTVRWPLYRSGIWINVRPASIAYLAEIDRALSFDRAQIGMDTSGLVNSVDSLIFDEKLVDAALRLVTWTNADVRSPMDLKSLIVTQDIPSVLMAMAAATFADGFTTTITCTDHKCRHPSTFDADLRRMSYVDSSRFSDKQIAFMDDIDPEVKHSAESIREYQAGFSAVEEGSYHYKGRIFDFGTGTIDHIFGLGHEWITQIELAMKESLQDTEISAERRASILSSILTAETLCRYAHYIKAIRIPQTNASGDEVIVTIDDRKSINDILRHLMTDEEGADGLMKAIQDYIVDSELVIHGYRNVECRKCHNYHLDDQGAAKLIIPIKVGQTFFTLLQQRITISGIMPVTDLETSGIHAFVQRALAQGSKTLSTQEQRALLSTQPSNSETPTT